MRRSVYSEIGFNKIKSVLYFVIFSIFITGFFGVIGYYEGEISTYLALGVSLSCFSIFLTYFFSASLILRTLKAKPALKSDFFNLYTVTENLCLASGLPMPKIYVIEDKSPNAFATGRNPRHAVICVTTGLLQILDRSELEGVIAHEISHIKNYDVLLASMIALLSNLIFLTTRMRFLNNPDFRIKKNPLGLFTLCFYYFFTLFAPIIAIIIQLAISRQREYLADADASLLTRYPEALANALEKLDSYRQGLIDASYSNAHLFIVNPLKQTDAHNWLSNLFSTHPPVKKRVEILRNI